MDEVRKMRRRRRKRKRLLLAGCCMAALCLVCVTAVICVRSNGGQTAETAEEGREEGMPSGQRESRTEGIRSEGTAEGRAESHALNGRPENAGNPDRETPVVVLDAGHGGKDPGCIAKDGTYEKDINLAIVKKIRDYLEEKGIDVRMTREGDTYPTLKERVATAEDCGADLFISIHQNAVENDTKTSGIETYCEKAANAKSPELAEKIQNALIQATGAHDRGTITSCDLYVVRHTTMPSCLVETGFLTSKTEGASLKNGTYQSLIAETVGECILEFLKENGYGMT